MQRIPPFERCVAIQAMRQGLLGGYGMAIEPMTRHSRRMPDLRVIQLDSLAAVPCPCGSARRAFGTMPGGQATVHLVEIKSDSETHYHRRTTEIYVVLEGEGVIELDGERFPVRPLTAVYIPPGCRHRAVGKLKLLNIPIPPFDPTDEYVTAAEQGMPAQASALGDALTR